jgi:hypothetical protein
MTANVPMPTGQANISGILYLHAEQSPFLLDPGFTIDDGETVTVGLENNTGTDRVINVAAIYRGPDASV